jgi:hypothetical protein
VRQGDNVIADRDWFTSSFTNGTGFDDGSVLVRDTKNRRDSTGSPMIVVDAAGWTAFVKSVAGR